MDGTMKANDFPLDLQQQIREYFHALPRGTYTQLARDLGIIPRAVYWNLAVNSRRRMTFDCLGRLALYRPADWDAIQQEQKDDDNQP